MRVLISSVVSTCILIFTFGISGHHIFGTFIFLFLMIDFVQKIGRQFVFIELLALIAWLQWIIGPIIFENLGVKMFVPYDAYFLYTYTASVLYLVGLYLPTYRYINNTSLYSDISDKLQTYVARHHKTGIILVSIGAPAWILQPYAPPAISFILNLLSYFLLLGTAFLIFTSFRGKALVIAGVFIIMLSNTLLNGMIGVMIFWVLMLFIYRSLLKPIYVHVFLKWVFLIAGFWVLAILQSSKTEYRDETWNIKDTVLGEQGKREIKQDPILFYTLVKERVLNPSLIFSVRSSFEIFSRLNQGLLVSKAMEYVPRHHEYGYGDVTVFTTLTAFIPRFLWSDKPSIGAQDYVKKYTGLHLGKYHSATLGPIGDAYVDFGKWGPVFLLILGLLIGSYFKYFLLKSLENPVYMLWFIIPFYTSLTVSEISVPGYINGLFKIILFLVAARFILVNSLRLRL